MTVSQNYANYFIPTYFGASTTYSSLDYAALAIQANLANPSLPIPIGAPSADYSVSAGTSYVDYCYNYLCSISSKFQYEFTPPVVLSSTKSKSYSNPFAEVSSYQGISGSGTYNSKALPEIANSSIMKNVPAQTKAKILDAVDRACKKYNVDPKLVISLMYTESGFRPDVTSPCGAAGLMQLMPATAKTYGANNPYDIEQNIFAGVKFLKYLLDRYNGNTDLAVAAYNAGPGRVTTHVPNIRETKNHVAKVNRAYSSLC